MRIRSSMMSVAIRCSTSALRIPLRYRRFCVSIAERMIVIRGRYWVADTLGAREIAPT
jgi:hypothetical protein